MSNDSKRVVVWDPTGDLPEGEVMSEALYRTVVGRGVAALPVDADLLQRGGAYVKRAWGKGYEFNHAVPDIGCEMALYATREHARIHWTALLVPDGSATPVAGRLQINVCRALGGSCGLSELSPGARAQDVVQGPQTGSQGWLVGGTAVATFGQDTHHGFGLFGSLQGLLVRWAAFTVTAR